MNPKKRLKRTAYIRVGMSLKVQTDDETYDTVVYDIAEADDGSISIACQPAVSKPLNISIQSVTPKDPNAPTFKELRERIFGDVQNRREIYGKWERDFDPELAALKCPRHHGACIRAEGHSGACRLEEDQSPRTLGDIFVDHCLNHLSQPD